MIAKNLILPLAGLVVAVSAGQAWAGSKIFSSGTSPMVVNGSVEANASNNTDPFLAQVFTTGGECLRIAVTSQGADLKATLVSPSGRVWRDDDSNGSLRPLIKAITDVRGWYPLSIAHFAGNPVNADFTMQVRRLASTDPLCASATTPALASTQRLAKSQDAGSPPVGPNNGE